VPGPGRHAAAVAPGVNDVLLGLLAAHGVDATMEDGWIAPAGRSLRMSGEIVQEKPGPNAVTVQLDVRVRLWAGGELVDSCGGVGPTRDEAVADAVNGFVAGSFHVLLAAFLGKETEQVTREEWVVSGRSRAVTVGGVFIRGPMPEPRADWVTVLREKIQALGLPGGTHWIRLFYAQLDRRPMAHEALLDNAGWPELQAQMAQVDWPPAEGYYSARLFMVVQGGVSVSQAVGLIAEMKDAEDEAIRERLRALGASVAQADRLVAFIPMAFGRVLLRSMPIRFSDTVVIADAAGKPRRESRLDEEAVFVEARRLAEAAVTEGTLGQEAFSAVALRSAEVDVVNQGLNAGAQPEDMKFTAAIAFVDEEEEVAPGRRRPWWKLWG